MTETERLALRENARKILQESRLAAMLQEINKASLKGRGWFDEYDSGVIMKWGTGYTRRHIWVHIEGEEIWIRLKEHRACSADMTPARCDGEYHAYTRKQWSRLDLMKTEILAYYEHPVAESSDD